MKRMIAMLICCGALGLAQEPAAGTAKTVQAGLTAEKHQWLQKVIDVKYADVNALSKLLGNLVQGDLDPRYNRVIAQPDLHAISIGTYDPAFLQMAEEMIKRYDVATWSWRSRPRRRATSKWWPTFWSPVRRAPPVTRCQPISRAWESSCDRCSATGT